MTTVRQEERRALIDRVLALSPKTYIFSGLGGNISLIYSEIERQVRNGAIEWQAFDLQNVHRIAVKAATPDPETGRVALTPNPRSVEAFQAAFSGDAAQKSGIAANEEIVLAELVSRGPLECTPENILQIIGDKWDSLADNPAYTQQKTANDLRARRIAEMVGDPPTHGFSLQIGPRRYAFNARGQSHDYQQGMAQGGSMALKGPWSAGHGGGFDSMSDAEVENIWNLFRTSQDLKSKSVEELRAIVKSGGHSDLHGNHQSIRLPSTAIPGDEGALINPATQREFTQRELIRFINDPSNPYAGRKLITHPSSGKVIAAKRQRFEEIIKGLRG